MAKSDYTCKKCKKVISESFFSVGTFKKFECPNCGTLCKNCVDSGIFSTKCKHCGQKVITKGFVNGRWTQI